MILVSLQRFPTFLNELHLFLQIHKLHFQVYSTCKESYELCNATIDQNWMLFTWNWIPDDQSVNSLYGFDRVRERVDDAEHERHLESFK